MIKRLVAIIIAVVIICGIYPANIMADSTTESITWVKTTKESESNNFYDITYNNDKIYIAVGDDGAIVRSEDTKIWNSVSAKTTENLNAIATNGKNFVTVGSNGIILYSTDGEKWSKSKVNFNKEYTYQGVTGKIKTYVEKIYKINWSAKVKQSQLHFTDILWDGEKYVAIGNWKVNTGKLIQENYGYSSTYELSSNFILTSKDGKKWTANYANVPDWSKIIYTGKKYMAISDESIITSTDLKKWKIIEPKIRGDFSDIIYANGQYMTIGWDGNVSARTGTIYTSKDGLKWKAVINKKVIGSGVSEDKDTYGKPNGFSDLVMNSLLWDGKQYIIAGLKGMILTSKTGNNWTKLNEYWNVNHVPLVYDDYSGKKANINKIIYDGEQYIEVGNNSTILVTKDLKEGIIARTRPNVDFENITYDGEGRYLAQGEYDTIWESDSGYNWRQVDIDNDEDEILWEGIASHNGKALALCQTRSTVNSAFYYYSDKPGSWIKKKFPHKFNLLYGVKYIKDKFYVFTERGFMTSKDGLKWSDFTASKVKLNNITYNGENYVGQSSYADFNVYRNALYTSSDCKKWSKVILKRGGKQYYLTASSIVWTGKQFVTIGGEMHQVGEEMEEYDVVAFSKDGKKWSIKSTNKSYFKTGAYGNKIFVAIDYDGNLYKSTNGIDYIKSNKGTSQELNMVMWDGKKFFITGEMGIILASVMEKNSTIPKQDTWIDAQENYSIAN